MIKVWQGKYGNIRILSVAHYWPTSLKSLYLADEAVIPWMRGISHESRRVWYECTLIWSSNYKIVLRWGQTSGASFWPTSSEDMDQLRWFINNSIGQIHSHVDSHDALYNRNRVSIGFIGNGVFTTAKTELRANLNSINMANWVRKDLQLHFFTRGRVRICHGGFIEYNYSSCRWTWHSGRLEPWSASSESSSTSI